MWDPGDRKLPNSRRILGGNLTMGCWSLLIILIILIATTGHADTGAEDPPLIQAAEAGRFVDVQRLLAAGADLTATTSDGWTALHWAVYKGHDDVVTMLLGAGADPTATTLHGWTALHAAADMGRVDMLAALLGVGADPTATTRDGWTALHRANSVDVVTALLAAGADVHARDK